VTRPRPVPYLAQLLDELEQIRTAVVDVLERSQINRRDLPDFVITTVRFAWAPSHDALRADRMT